MVAKGGRRDMHARAQALPPAATIGYLRVDARPVKQALLAWVTKWIFLFTNYLEGKVHATAFTATCVLTPAAHMA